MAEMSQMLMQSLQTTRGMIPTGQIFKIDFQEPTESFIRTILSTWKVSPRRQQIIEAEKYFQNRNAVCDKKRDVVTTGGVVGESTLLTNTKIAHPFLRKLIRQKVSFLFSTPFDIHAENNDTFTDLLMKNYFDSQLRKTIKATVTHAIGEGICFLLPYYNDDSQLAFKRISAKNAIPFWANEEHTQLNAFIHFYDIMLVNEYSLGISGEKPSSKIRKIEYYTPEGIWYFQIDQNGLFGADPDAPSGNGMNAHFYQGMKKLSDTGIPINDENGNPVIDMAGQSWNTVPIIPFKYNEDELPLLELVKSLIDDYDSITSSISDNVHDIPNSIKIVKGYSGTDPDTFVRNVSTYRVIFLDESGSVDDLASEIHISETDVHLDRLKKDIFESGDGIDIQTDQLGDVSGAALKYRFSPLAEDVNDLGEETIAAIQQMLYYIRMDLKMRNIGNYMEVPVTIQFPQVAIVNEAETIDNISKSMNIVSRQTLLAHHPYVKDVTEEIRLFNEQQKADLALENSMLPKVTATGNKTANTGNKVAVVGDY